MSVKKQSIEDYNNNRLIVLWNNGNYHEAFEEIASLQFIDDDHTINMVVDFYEYAIDSSTTILQRFMIWEISRELNKYGHKMHQHLINNSSFINIHRCIASMASMPLDTLVFQSLYGLQYAVDKDDMQCVDAFSSAYLLMRVRDTVDKFINHAIRTAHGDRSVYNDLCYDCLLLYHKYRDALVDSAKKSLKAEIMPLDAYGIS